jgi:hypothetical protein
VLSLSRGVRFALVMFFTTDSTPPPPGVDTSTEASAGEAFWRLGAYPETLEDFLTFMPHWHAFLGDEAAGAAGLMERNQSRECHQSEGGDQSTEDHHDTVEIGTARSSTEPAES